MCSASEALLRVLSLRSLVFWSLCCEVEVEEGYSRRYEGLAYVAVFYC